VLNWQPNASWLFQYLDKTLWEMTQHNPVKFLQQISPAKLEAAAAWGLVGFRRFGLHRPIIRDGRQRGQGMPKTARGPPFQNRQRRISTT
jgi:hypothetical protein